MSHKIPMSDRLKSHDQSDEEDMVSNLKDRNNRPTSSNGLNRQGTGELRRMQDYKSAEPMWDPNVPVTWSVCEYILLMVAWFIVGLYFCVCV